MTSFLDYIEYFPGTFSLDTSSGNPEIGIISGPFRGLISCPGELYPYLHRCFFGEWLSSDAKDLLAEAPMLLRFVRASRLELVLQNGIDVEPVNGTLFALPSLMGFEYGQLSYGRSGQSDRTAQNADEFKDMLILGLNPRKLKRTFVEIASSTEESEVNRLQETYPYKHATKDGAKIILSRHSRPGDFDPYETDCAYWIEESAHDALVKIALIGTDRGRLREICFSLGRKIDSSLE